MLNTVKSALLLAAACLPLSAYAQDISTMSPEEALPFLDAMTPGELLPLAQKEGQVVVFSLSSRIARVEAAFEAQYPGVDLVGVDLSSTKQIARVVAEQQAGVYAVDVLYLADTPIVYSDLLAQGRIHNYVPPRVAGDPAAHPGELHSSASLHSRMSPFQLQVAPMWQRSLYARQKSVGHAPMWVAAAPVSESPGEVHARGTISDSSVVMASRAAMLCAAQQGKCRPLKPAPCTRSRRTGNSRTRSAVTAGPTPSARPPRQWVTFTLVS